MESADPDRLDLKRSPTGTVSNGELARRSFIRRPWPRSDGLVPTSSAVQPRALSVNPRARGVRALGKADRLHSGRPVPHAFHKPGSVIECAANGWDN
jgi:hypothetical protein